MTDLEMTGLCAEAMGLKLIAGRLTADGEVFFWSTDSAGAAYCPLHDDAQAMALVKRFSLDLWWDRELNKWWADYEYSETQQSDLNENLNAAIVECVAKLKGAKL